MADDDDLSVLLGHVDDWFKELKPPIDQFDLELDKNTDIDSKSNKNSKKQDDIKLRLITRTTNNWFKSLLKPAVCDFNLEVESKFDTKIELGDDDEEVHLDELAKNLELLLDDNERTPESPIHYFPFYSNFEQSIFDPGVGHCCTIDELSPASMNSATGSSNESTQSYQVLLTNSQLHDSDGYSSSSSSSRCNSITNQQSTNCDLIKVEPSDKHIQTPMPLDHEYLPRPKQKPLLMCNRISSIGAEKFLMATCKGQKLASVLNTGAIRRFARFSHKLRLLSCD